MKLLMRNRFYNILNKIRTSFYVAILLFAFLLFQGCFGGGSDGGGAKTSPSVAAGKYDFDNLLITDPLASYAWHLRNQGQKTFSTNAGVLGIDLNLVESYRKGFTGQGIKILVSDEGVESEHQDLGDNFLRNKSRDYTKEFPYISDTAEPVKGADSGNHGTAVSGIIAGVAGNYMGSFGVAFNAKIASANILNPDAKQTIETFLDQITGDFDIFNQSWGVPQCLLSNPTSENDGYLDQIAYEAVTNRSGKGALYVKSAGNDYLIDINSEACGGGSGSGQLYRAGNSNFDYDNTSPHIIVVAAINASGISSSYSSSGSNIWISALGGEFGDDDPAILTTDLMGCSFGYSYSGSTVNQFSNGQSSLNHNCNYTATMNGTSAAAAMISGAIGILLSSNPNLTARDVKYILASTATQIDFNQNGSDNPAGIVSPSGHLWEQGWVTNAAGFKFHNWYGFGLVNIDAAVAVATNNFTSLPSQLQTINGDGTWIYSSGAMTATIPDNSIVGANGTIQVNHDLITEAVQIQIDITHADVGQIGIELTSPSGTKSILKNVNDSLEGVSNLPGTTFISNAFYGESSSGLWKIKVIDGKSGIIGKLNFWKINIWGN